jgi:hypothetical protein
MWLLGEERSAITMISQVRWLSPLRGLAVRGRRRPREPGPDCQLSLAAASGLHPTLCRDQPTPALASRRSSAPGNHRPRHARKARLARTIASTRTALRRRGRNSGPGFLVRCRGTHPAGLPAPAGPVAARQPLTPSADVSGRGASGRAATASAASPAPKEAGRSTSRRTCSLVE